MRSAQQCPSCHSATDPPANYCQYCGAVINSPSRSVLPVYEQSSATIVSSATPASIRPAPACFGNLSWSMGERETAEILRANGFGTSNLAEGGFVASGRIYDHGTNVFPMFEQGILVEIRLLLACDRCAPAGPLFDHLFLLLREKYGDPLVAGGGSIIWCNSGGTGGAAIWLNMDVRGDGAVFLVYASPELHARKLAEFRDQIEAESGRMRNLL